MEPTNPFLAEVLANPEDDVPRLIYADWLEEQGDPRGEFIRLQCEIANSDSHQQLDPHYDHLLARNKQLLDEYGAVWAKEVKQDVRKAEFHRGFLSTITMRARAFVKEGEQLLDRTPVNWLRFNYLKGVGDDVAQCPWLSKVQSLDLSRLVVPLEDMLALFRSPHFTNLRRLKLVMDRPGILVDAVGRALAESNFADSLEYLDFGGSSYEQDFLLGLASGNGYARLRRLSIGPPWGAQSTNGIDRLNVPSLESLRISGDLAPADVLNLCELPLDQCKVITFTGTINDGRDLELLSEQGAFEKVEQFTPGRVNPPSSLAGIFQGDNFAKCKVLQLWHVDGGDYSYHYNNTAEDYALLAKAIAEHDGLANLERLHLGRTNDYDLGLILLSPRFKKLQILSVEMDDAGWGIGTAGALQQSPSRTTLKALHLTGTLTVDGIRGLNGIELPNLESLSFTGSFYNNDDWRQLDAAMEELMLTARLPKLRLLNLSHSQLGDRTLFAIAEQPAFAELRGIKFHGNYDSEEGVRAALNSPHLTKVEYLTTHLQRTLRMIAEFGDRMK